MIFRWRGLRHTRRRFRPPAVFQVHGIDAAEKVVVRKQLRRSQVLEFFKALLPCLIGMEACATAPYWARELAKLGHQIRLMPAKDVKAYVKCNKNDAADAEAICEAVRRPTHAFCADQDGGAAGAVGVTRAPLPLPACCKYGAALPAAI